MGHKVHPNAFRLGVYRTWEANWFATNKDYTKLLHEDLAMRRLIMGRLRNAGIAKIETERSSNAQMTITIRTAKPGIVIGKGGASVDQLRNDLEKTFGNRVRISIDEIKQPELDAQLVAENIASQLERRISHRRAMKQSILRTMRAGAKGVRIMMGGRLRGAEMARRHPVLPCHGQDDLWHDRNQGLDLQGRVQGPHTGWRGAGGDRAPADRGRRGRSSAVRACRRSARRREVRRPAAAASWRSRARSWCAWGSGR